MGELTARHLPRFAAMVWIDVHTGLGPYGHGEKIFVGSDAAELARANATGAPTCCRSRRRARFRRWWKGRW